MALTVYDLLERLGLADYLEDLPEEAEEILEQDIEVHHQPSYPLMATVSNVKVSNGKVMLALNESYGYGDKSAWEEEY